jgi:hypothetical protein
MSRNPSELQRLHEEALSEERNNLLRAILSNRTSGVGDFDKGLKASKEQMLRRVREIERELGIPSIPYNSSAFGGSDGDTAR